jgi:hypothetical protein
MLPELRRHFEAMVAAADVLLLDLDHAAGAVEVPHLFEATEAAAASQHHHREAKEAAETTFIFFTFFSFFFWLFFFFFFRS